MEDKVDLINCISDPFNHACESVAMADLVAEVLPLNPTTQGIAFGVFDFGGGTTDFTIGLYRLPTEEEEEEQGWEQVIEILDSSGDENLGGEHLVEHLVFEVVKDNLAALREKGPFPFVKPLDAPNLVGSEEIFANSVIARENTRKLMEQLRSIWEGDKVKDDDTGQISLTLKPLSGNATSMQLNVNKTNLKAMLKRRISVGVEKFFSTFGQAFMARQVAPKQFHILLGGNSCKSPLVMECFIEKSQAILGAAANVEDAILIYPAPKIDKDNPEAVTLKTGVAIGLLQTLDGEPFGIVNRHSNQQEASFAWYLGPLVKNILKPKLARHAPYNQWQNFGKVRAHGICKFLYTLSPLAIEERVQRGDDCYEESIDWGVANAGKTIAVRPIAPNKVEFALQGENGDIIADSIREVELKK